MNDLLAKYTTYDKVDSLLGDNLDISFMNHGVVPVHERASHLFMDTSASMYCRFLDKIEDPKNKKILEVGCGRGGGANLMKTAYEFDEVHACDIEPKAIRFCQSQFKDIHFSIDDAQRLNNYRDNTFDCVINVESSHCYRNPEGFFKSVRRVLKSEGMFLYIDVFKPEIMHLYDAAVQRHFKVLEKIDITTDVYLSCLHSISKIERFLSENDLPAESAYHFLHTVTKSKSECYRDRIDLYFAYILKK